MSRFLVSLKNIKISQHWAKFSCGKQREELPWGCPSEGHLTLSRLPGLSHILQGVHDAQTPGLSLWFVHAIPFAPNVFPSLSPGKLRLLLKPEHKCLFFQDILNLQIGPTRVQPGPWRSPLQSRHLCAPLPWSRPSRNGI